AELAARDVDEGSLAGQTLGDGAVARLADQAVDGGDEIVVGQGGAGRDGAHAGQRRRGATDEDEEVIAVGGAGGGEVELGAEAAEGEEDERARIDGIEG